VNDAAQVCQNEEQNRGRRRGLTDVTFMSQCSREGRERPGALPLDQAGAVGPRPQFYCSRVLHRPRAGRTCSVHCARDSRRAALLQAAARRRGSRGQSPLALIYCAVRRRSEAGASAAAAYGRLWCCRAVVNAGVAHAAVGHRAPGCGGARLRCGRRVVVARRRIPVRRVVVGRVIIAWADDHGRHADPYAAAPPGGRGRCYRRANDQGQGS
jgi:hypothetical protein